MDLCIVGCGTVGSSIIEMYSRRSLEIQSHYKELILIDPDCDDSSDKFIYPKVYALYDMALDINPLLKIHPMIGVFPDVLNNFEKDKINNTVFVDCRDNNEQSDLCYIKIASDGPYGSVIKYPTQLDGIPSNYKIKKSKYYSLLTVCRVIEDIMNMKEPYIYTKKKSKNYIFNHIIPF
jgi:hypothetical protein